MNRQPPRPCTIPHLTETQAELLRNAVDTAIDRDAWRREAQHLEDGCDDPHCGLLWRIWTEAAQRQAARADAAEAVLVEILTNPADAGPAIAAWRREHGPDCLANVPTPAPWRT